MIVSCCLLVAGGAAAKDTGVRFERDADFSGYQEYGWSQPVKKPEGSPTG